MSDEEIRAVIAKYLKLRVRKNQDVYKAIGMPKATYFLRLKEPQTFRIGELKRIFDYLKVPQTERTI